MDKSEMTIIISCAGMGTRLGIGTTKALVHVGGKTIIARQLELLKDYDDVRVVVGYQAEGIIEEVNKTRRDVMFAFNGDYKTTGAGASLSKALRGTRKYVVAMDGDLLFRPEDFERFMEEPGECIGVCEDHSDEPIRLVQEGDFITKINDPAGTKEWSCITKVLAARLTPGEGGIDEMIRPLLPLKAVPVAVCDLDTQDDFERMLNWFRKGYKD